jgi:pimeloyl-ACP methyl ester carboxylesterase
VRSFDGTSIYWELHGLDPDSTPNPTLVFCYGLVCSMNQWRAQIEHFKHTHPCLLFDYRGHHRSSYPDDSRSMNLSALAKDAAAIIHHRIKPGKSCHVWGHSMGCLVALELALAEPALVRSLLLCCGNVENPFKTMFGTNALEKAVQTLLGLFPNNKEAFYKAWKILLSKPEIARYVVMFAGFNRQAVESEDIDTYVQAVASVHARTFFPLMIELTKGNTRNILARISTPTLVVAGAQDYVTPPRNQRSMARDLANAEYFEVPSGSHNVQLDFGDYVCLKAEEFWKKHELL